jgi:hypothetical protein
MFNITFLAEKCSGHISSLTLHTKKLDEFLGIHLLLVAIFICSILPQGKMKTSDVALCRELHPVPDINAESYEAVL